MRSFSLSYSKYTHKQTQLMQPPSQKHNHILNTQHTFDTGKMRIQHTQTEAVKFDVHVTLYVRYTNAFTLPHHLHI